ncbi:hypothetical protein HELRODRAFT_166847 [Helobdella robusta]|uniref:Endonuclease/exonuclease/phosphatase domain-containing protein n=1 Tax=Helobdella robusta TaxID=6412 RepID=T1EYM4_HELRO|nr:hypothetical protein HELRODRAFT_166847 [Helobdella robusta]ESO11801.1 hypothetical protein HELRODRAFT_166847 [Helobdella robusta]
MENLTSGSRFYMKKLIVRLPPPMLPPHVMSPGQSRLRPPPLGLAIRTPVPPPGLPQGIQGPNLPSSLKSLTQNNILSAPPSYAKTSSIAEKSHPSSGSKSEISVTISAKPKIRNLIGDVTRFTPIAVKIKREVKDIKGQAVKSAFGLQGPSLLIMGDFNIHINDRENHISSGFIELIPICGLVQLVNPPIHGSGNILDLVIVYSAEPFEVKSLLNRVNLVWIQKGYGRNRYYVF